MDKQHKTYAWIAFLSTILLLLILFGFLSILVAFGSTTNIMLQTGLQRARVERMTKDVLLIVGPSNGADYTQSVSELQDVLPLWRVTQRGLQVGDASIGLPFHPPSDILLTLIQAQSDYAAMEKAYGNILAKPTDTSEKAQIQVQIVLDHEGSYYKLMSQVVVLWQQHIDDSVLHLFWIEAGIVGLVVVCVVVNFVGMMQWARKSHEKGHN